MSKIPTWHERAMAHPDHQSGMISEGMIRARMAEEIADLRAEIERLTRERDEARAEIENLYDQIHRWVDDRAKAQSQADRLREQNYELQRERDEARAEVERLRDEDTKTRHALRGWVWVCPDGGDEPTHERVSAVVAEVERLTRERDESKSKETDYREGFDEGWAAAQKGAVDEVEKLRAALKFYAHEYCELGEAFEGCGKLLVEQCGGCLARAALEAKP